MTTFWYQMIMFVLYWCHQNVYHHRPFIIYVTVCWSSYGINTVHGVEYWVENLQVVGSNPTHSCTGGIWSVLWQMPLVHMFQVWPVPILNNSISQSLKFMFIWGGLNYGIITWLITSKKCRHLSRRVLWSMTLNGIW